MSTIEELTEERDRLYEEHNEAFQAWMDAEVALANAVNEEAVLQHRAARVRKYAFLTGLGLVGAILVAHWWVV
jgi:hypothetical protein